MCFGEMLKDVNVLKKIREKVTRKRLC